jgi:hypothetical protein
MDSIFFKYFRKEFPYIILVFSLAFITSHFSAAAAEEIVPHEQLEKAVARHECDKCQGYVLPGRVVPSPYSEYTLWSDLPEVFCSNGVLYANTPVLPSHPEGDVPEAMLVQEQKEGFQYIDGSFDVFLFHTVYHCRPKSPSKRIAVYVRNDGDAPVVLEPKQIISTDGEIGRVHQMESDINRRIMEDRWDRPIDLVKIEPGQGAVVAYSKRFAAEKDGPDSSTSTNCFGFVRTELVGEGVEGLAPRLTVFVVAVDARPVPALQKQVEEVLDLGALSGDTVVDMTTPPSGCQVRRATGVFRSYVWESRPVMLDVSKIEEQKEMAFLMAAWENGTRSCPGARQTADLLIHPPYTRPDTIGNYMVDHIVRLTLDNPSETKPRTVDLRFRKEDADVGLAWRTLVKAGGPVEDIVLLQQPVVTGWAGPKQEDVSRSFLAEGQGLITIPPGEQKSVGLHFQVIGNSSLPFDLVVRVVE